MTIIRLIAETTMKPWGRHVLGPGFAALGDSGSPVGEVRYDLPPEAAAGDPELLVKYLFTDAPLSIQVHPDDDRARRLGYPRGKDEAWFVVAAAPGAVIGLGTRTPIDREVLRAAALDGTIVDLLVWRPVTAGTMIYSPAGTVHAIGAGLTLVEVQQNLDLTYRLYDYGSGRALHLDDGIAAAHPVPAAAGPALRTVAPGRDVLSGAKFTLERLQRSGQYHPTPARPLWLIPLTPATVNGMTMEPGEVWRADSTVTLVYGSGSELLLAYPGSTALDATAVREMDV